MLNMQRFCLHSLEELGVQICSGSHDFLDPVSTAFVALNVDTACVKFQLAVKMMGNMSNTMG